MKLSIVYFIASALAPVAKSNKHLRRTADHDTGGDRQNADNYENGQEVQLLFDPTSKRYFEEDEANVHRNVAHIETCVENENAIFLNSLGNRRTCKWISRRDTQERIDLECHHAKSTCPITCNLCRPTNNDVVASDQVQSGVVNTGDKQNGNDKAAGKLQRIGCTRAKPCAKCRGDCDNDAQCQSDLKCFFRNGMDPVPGCKGDVVSALDYCIDPTDKVLESTVTPERAPKPSPKPTPLPTPEPPAFDSNCGNDKLDLMWDICMARKRLEACKRKAREEDREGRSAWDDLESRVLQGGLNLKLYCRFSYRWQDGQYGSRYCPKYCLEASKMRAGATLEIKDCSSSPLQKFMKVNDVLRPAWKGGENLCIESDTLRKCNTKLVYKPEKNTDHFEIKLEERDELCFSNPHHPKVCEPVRFSECKEAQNSRTNYWHWVDYD